MEGGTALFLLLHTQVDTVFLELALYLLLLPILFIFSPKNLLGFSWEIVMTFEHGKRKSPVKIFEKISKLWLATQISKFPSLPKIQNVRKMTVYGLELRIFNWEKSPTFWLQVWNRCKMFRNARYIISEKKLENM